MKLDIDRYLSTLLSFSPNQGPKKRFSGDYISLIYVPFSGAERALSLTFAEEGGKLTIAQYNETVWKYLEGCESADYIDAKPSVNVIQANVDRDHPAFAFLGPNQLRSCESRSDDYVGFDYYLLMWQKDGYASVEECWEPYGRDDQSWMNVIGAMEVLASQYEHAILEA